MRPRHIALLLLFIAAIVVPGLLRRSEPAAASPPPPPPPVPEEALAALRLGRYWRASRILQGYLAATPDSTPESVLLTARAEAGWGGWPEVEKLLRGRRWLDSADAGRGWALLGRSHYEQREWSASGDAYGRFLRVASDAGGHERGLAALRRAIALAHDDREPASLALFDSARAALPQIDDWIEYYAARAAAQAGDTAAVERRLAGVGADLADRFGWKLRLDALERAGDPAAALAAAEAATIRLHDPAARASAFVRVGDLRLAAGDAAAATAAYRRAMSDAGSLAAIDGARKLSELPHLTPDDQLAIGRLYLRHGNAERGIRGVLAYLAAARGSALERTRLRYDVARAYFNAGRYRDAERRAIELADQRVDPAIAASALYLAGRAQYRQGKVSQSLATFRRTASRFPDQDAATRALFLVADLRHDAGDTATAREYYRRAIDSDAAADDAGLAVMRLADLAIVDDDYAAAARLFDGYRERFPDGRRIQQATYWAARAYQRLGEDSLALQRLEQTWRRDPFSYYGFRAGQQIGRGFEDARLRPAPQTTDSARSLVDAALVRLDLLRELGDDAAASTEVDLMRDRFRHVAGTDYPLAEALDARGFTATGIRIGWSIFDREGAWNPRLLRIVFPFPFRRLVLAEADDRGIDPFLLAGLIRQESSFDAPVVSGAGAIGLMQVVPATGRILARAEDVPDFRPPMLKQPEINLHLGTRYLKDLLDQYDGRIPAVLAAYNAGPSRVERWRGFPEWSRGELFTERIPYTETRDYVKIVQRNVALYRVLYGDSIPSAAPSD